MSETVSEGAGYESEYSGEARAQHVPAKGKRTPRPKDSPVEATEQLGRVSSLTS